VLTQKAHPANPSTIQCRDIPWYTCVGTHSKCLKCVLDHPHGGKTRCVAEGGGVLRVGQSDGVAGKQGGSCMRMVVRAIPVL
jgi:hypothetical protein